MEDSGRSPGLSEQLAVVSLRSRSTYQGNGVLYVKLQSIAEHYLCWSVSRMQHNCLDIFHRILSITLSAGRHLLLIQK